MNLEDLPAFLARRIRAEHCVTGPATEAQLLAICEQRACEVKRSPLLTRPGYYVVTEEGPLIILRHDAGPPVLAHELYHHLVHDNAAVGIIYAFPDFVELGADPDGEAAAQRFAALLCAPPAAPVSHDPDPPTQPADGGAPSDDGAPSHDGTPSDHGTPSDDGTPLF